MLAKTTQRWIKWAGAAVILCFLIRHIALNVDELRAANLECRFMPFVLSVCLLVLYFAGRALLWHLVTIKVGVSVAPAQAMVAWSYSLMGKYMPGKVFVFLLRLPAYLAAGKSKARLAVAFFIETVGTIIGYILVSLAVLPASDPGLFNDFRVAAPILLCLCLISIHPKVFGLMLTLACKIRGRDPLVIHLRSLDILILLVGFAANWLIAAIAFFAMASSVTPLEVGDAFHTVGAFSLASLGGIMSPITPAGLGVREGILGFLLSTEMPSAVAVLLSLLGRLWFTFGECICVAFAFAYSRFGQRMPMQQTATGD